MAARCSRTKPASERFALRRAWSKRARLNWPSAPWKVGSSMIERGDELVGDAEAELPGLLGHDGFGHEVVEHLLVDAEGAGLLGA